MKTQQKTRRLAVFVSITMFLTSSVLASTHTVLNLNDSGTDSLRYWISTATAGDTINFAPGLNGTITLTSGTLEINNDLTVVGPGAAMLRISGNNAVTVLAVYSGTVTLSGVAIVHGRASVNDGTVYEGGGIYNTANLTINRCVISGNTNVHGNLQFSVGGGVYNHGFLTVNDSTVSDNSTEDLGGGLINNTQLTMNNCTVSANISVPPYGEGGGIFGDVNAQTVLNNCTLQGNVAPIGGAVNAGDPSSESSSDLQLNNCTIYANSATDQFGGVFSFSPLEIHNTIIAGNSGGDIYQNWQKALVSAGHNFIGSADDSAGWVASDLTGSNAHPLDPALDVLADNGGPTFTMALQPGSAAIDAGDDAIALTTDQRGRPRKAGAHVDIGAYEVNPPQTLIVLNQNDSGIGSLRQAISDAYRGDIVTFAPAVKGTIALSGELAIDKSIDIAGPTATQVVISGNHSSRVFHITGGPVNMSNLTISDGVTNQPGGGIFTETGSSLNLNSCTVSGNTTSDSGGGIANNGFVTANTCTFSGNHAANGGGLYNFCGSLTLNCSTVTSNTALNGAGFYNYPTVCSFATINGTLIANNTASSSGPDLFGAFSSGGYNLIGKTDGLNGSLSGVNQLGSIASPLDPKLAPLQNNGGATFTHALLGSSPAIDRGRNVGLLTDQRGRPRTVDYSSIANASGGDGTDIGAFEINPPPISIGWVGSNLLVRWVDVGIPFTLESTSALHIPPITNNWTTVPGQFIVTNNFDVGTGNRFYRLRSP